MDRGKRAELNLLDEKCNTEFKIIDDDVIMKCKCKKNCNPTLDRWCNTIVYEIYGKDDYDKLQIGILSQIIEAIHDKINSRGE